jgi:hypothetical protein
MYIVLERLQKITKLDEYGRGNSNMARLIKEISQDGISVACAAPILHSGTVLLSRMDETG